MGAVIDGGHEGGAVLFGDAQHVEDVHAAAPGLKRPLHRVLEIGVAEVAAAGFPQLRVVRFRRPFKTEAGTDLAHALEQFLRRGVE